MTAAAAAPGLHRSAIATASRQAGTWSRVGREFNLEQKSPARPFPAREQHSTASFSSLSTGRRDAGMLLELGHWGRAAIKRSARGRSAPLAHCVHCILPGRRDTNTALSMDRPMDRSRASQEHETISQRRTGEWRCVLRVALRALLPCWPRSKNSIKPSRRAISARAAASLRSSQKKKKELLVVGRPVGPVRPVASQICDWRSLFRYSFQNDVCLFPSSRTGMSNKSGRFPGAARCSSRWAASSLTTYQAGATRTYIRLSGCITPEPRHPNTGRSQKSSVALTLCALPAAPSCH